MWGYGDGSSEANKKKDKKATTAKGIKKAKKVRGGSALDKRMCAAGFKKHCKQYTMQAARIRVTPELIAEMLQLDSEIYGAEWSFTDNRIILYAHGGSLPEVREGEQIPFVTPSLSDAVW